VGDEQLLAQHVQLTRELLAVVRQQLRTRPLPRHHPQERLRHPRQQLAGQRPHLAPLGAVLNPNEHEPLLAPGGDEGPAKSRLQR
jgi:hypothetical protein